MWVPTVPVGEDKSFQAFVDWMNKNDDEKDDDAVHAGTHFYRKVIKWTAKILRGGRRKEKREYDADEQQLAEVQRSIDEEETQINHQEVATEFGLTGAGLEELYRIWIQKVPAEGDTSFQAFVNWLKENDDRPENGRAVRAVTEDKRDFAAWLKKVFAPWKPKKTRGLEEDEAPTTRDGMHLFEAYRRWLKTVGDGEDKTLQRFFKLYNIQKPRSFENELSDESQLADFERREGEEEEEQNIPVKEEEEKIPVKVTDESKDTSDTNGGYSCEENSPCNIENIANEQFYFATASSDKFIQCDAWGGCHTLTCEDGLVWDDLIKTCGLRT